MKRNLSRIIIVVAFIVALGIGFLTGRLTPHSTAPVGVDSAAGNPAPTRKVLYWYDPMSPGTRFDKPGKSPFMDMDLVPRYADDTAQDGGVAISARQQQNLGVRTAPVVRRSLALQLAAFGTVAVDDRGVASVPALANGLVEKLYVNAPQQFVKKNTPLAQLWFPQWAAAQQEYLAVRGLGDGALITAARARLQLQFMPEEVIRAVERSGKPQTRVSVRAPEDGYVSKLNVRAGAQVAAGQSLFELASLDPVWVVIDYPQSQASLLAVGNPVEATTVSWPGVVFHGKVAELLPDMDLATRTLKARVVLTNHEQQLKPGMFLNARLAQPAQATPVLAIPEEALIVTGASNRVLVSEGNGHFRPVEVVAGRNQAGWVEIQSGLEEGQQVVTSGQFLIDSEASLRSVLPQMTDASARATPPAPVSYSTQGVVQAVSADAVTIAHEPVAALHWAAMTMDFAVTAEQRQQLRPGESVMFSFALDDDGARIVSVMPMPGHKEQP